MGQSEPSRLQKNENRPPVTLHVNTPGFLRFRRFIQGEAISAPFSPLCVPIPPHCCYRGTACIGHSISYSADQQTLVATAVLLTVHNMRNPIIVALDVPEVGRALRLVEELAPLAGAFKVGSQLFTSAGPDIVRRIRAEGTAVFLDLKFHDIPNTVAHAIEAAVGLDVQMLTVHVSGGTAMLQAAEKAAHDAAGKLRRMPPLILGVTVLTSFDSSELNEIGVQSDVARQVERLAELAVRAGLRGLVCSPLEVVGLRQLLPSHVQLVTPGIRAPGEASGDQKRTLSPAEAIEAGADWLVMGRPICASSDPRAALERVLSSLPA
jgi:orotidine-5'-phosphate decarboxylase